MQWHQNAWLNQWNYWSWWRFRHNWRLCSERNVNIDEDEPISLSDIKINAYALYSDSRTYSIEVSVYTTLEASEDFDKVKYLDGLIEARNRVVDTSFQHRVGNIIKLPFYFVIADKDKSRMHYRHYPTPCVVWPDYVDENKFASVFFGNGTKSANWL